MQKIWTFKECEAVETDSVDLKTFKPTGKFYDDAEALCRAFNIKVHPSLKATIQSPPSEGQPAGVPAHEELKEVTIINFNKHRVDKNSMRALFFSLPASPNIQTLK